jgi:serine phosphatase RsbU (regulator of sigma subunit)
VKRRPLLLSLVACVLGLSILGFGFPKYWPANKWTLLPSDELIQQGRHVAEHFGLNVDGWDAYVVPTVSKSLTHYGMGGSPVSVRITYVKGKDEEAVEVGFDSAGSLNYWRAPAKFKGQRSESDEAAAQAVFQFVAGAQAASYTSPRHSSGDDEGEEEFEFRKTPGMTSDLRERIKVTTKNTSVERVERKVYLASDDDDEEAGGIWPVLGALSGFVYVSSFVVIIGIFILWLARKATNRRFPLRIAIAAFVLEMMVAVSGLQSQKAHSIHTEQHSSGGTELFSALGVMVIVAVGRGISLKTRPKWISLEQLCRLAPIAKPTGEAMAVGLLCGPLLAALPFVTLGCGLFPQSWMTPQSVELLYSRSPALDSIPLQVCMSLLLFFGFALPATERLIRLRWFRWPLMLPVAVVFFAPHTAVVWGPLMAVLASTLLTVTLFWFVWAHFDLLAVLTMQIASGLVLGMFVLAHQGRSSWGFVAMLTLLGAGALWCCLRGEAEAVGDPLATNPMVTGFRAEREKLVAEFSVARRAQQDMLPQAPPVVPGYSIAASCTPSLEVGGDLYDFLKLKDGRIGIGVADVSGKGVPAALYMTLTKGLLSAVTRNNSELKTVIEEVNRHLHGVTRKKVFVTMALGFLDVEKRLLQCVRAGHNPMVWRQKEKNNTRLVSPGGLGLGITAGRVFGTQLKVEEMQLAEGDAVVFYSDGITEAMNRSLEQFGEQRLMDAVDRTDSLNAAAARDSILTEVHKFLDGVHPQDDMTLVVLRVGERQ